MLTSFALVMTLFGNSQQALAASSTTTTLALTSGAAAVTTLSTGSVLTLTATVNAGSVAVTTGQVNFCDAAFTYCTDIHLLGTAQLTSAGTAVLKLLPGIGNHSYKAVFLGTAGYTTSNSPNSPLAVTGKSATITSIAQSGTVNNYTLTATIAGEGSAAPTGLVSFLDSSNSNAVLGSGTLVANPSGLGFVNVQSPATGNQPDAVAVGDFNGDGLPDLAVANRADNTVTIFLGNGLGTFTALGTPVPTGNTPVAIGVGDFNGDGFADLAVVNRSDGNVSILLGDGTGNFTLAATPTAGDDPVALVIGDFNGDGWPDIAVANDRGNTVTVMIGNGDGTFGITADVPVTGNSPDAIAAGDFNGDGNLDLVVANDVDNTLTVLLGTGIGTFTPASGTPPATGRSPQSLVVADFNGDGKADLAVANSLDNTLTLFLGNGDGTFAVASTPSTGNLPYSVAAGDFNGDGNVDLAVANNTDGTVTVLLGAGNGTFTAATTSPAAGTSPWSIVAADLNGDGYSDIVTTDYFSGTATVLLSEQQTATASASAISVAGIGPHLAFASYPGDSNFGASVSASAPLYALTPVPVITPATGVYTTTPSVTITDSDGTAAIYYTTDGSTPTTASTLYAGAFPASSSEIVQAIAVASGYAQSATATALYTLNLPAAAAPVISLASGTYPSAQTVTISDPGTTIYFTTNGTPPTTASAVYTGAITVSSSETLVASAAAPGFAMSAPVSAQYIIASSSTSFIYSVAGNGSAGYQGDGGLATVAGLNSPSGTAFDHAGNLYIADTYNNRVRKITAGTGIITTVAGTGIAGYSGNGTSAINAQLNWPVALAFDSANNLYIADSYNYAVRRVDAVTGIITNYAGNGTLGYSGDTALAASAQLSNVEGIAFDAANNLFIADSGNNAVRKVNASTAIISTVAGNGTAGYSGDSGPAASALLNNPEGLAVDSAGNVYIADINNNAVRAINAITLSISTVAGDGTGAGGYVGDGGPATSAQLFGPMSVALDSSGNLYIADNQNSVIREVASSNQAISTVAGNGSFCTPLSGDGGPATSAGFCNPTGVSVDSGGNLYIADSLAQRIREVTVAGVQPAASAAVPVFSVSGGAYPAPQTVTISDATPGASIYITMDGTTATALSPGYYGPINVSGTVTVNAIAIAPGYQPSAPATGAYTINYPPVAVISTFAGNGVYGFSGSGASAASASLGYLQGLALDGSGNLYIADVGNNVVWMANPTSGLITVVAGNGTPGYSGDGGQAAAAQLYYPSGPAADPAGNLYIADSTNNVIRLVTAGTGVISTFAGNGVGSYSGDGTLATTAELASPTGVALDSAGNVYIADSANSRVRMVSKATGLIATVAGDGLYVDNGDGGLATSAGVQQPVALAFDSTGNLYIAEENGLVRKVTAATGIITTVAGDGDQGYSGDGGPATSAEISEPSLSFDQAGNLYIANPPSAVREVSATTGRISTVAGNGLTGFTGDGGSATVAELDQPQGVVVDAAGNLYIADANNFRVRKVTFPGPAATPQITLAAGSYVNTRTTTITDTTPGASIYYTADGTTPSEASTLYSGQVTIAASETLQAIAVAKGYTVSAVASAAYIIIPPAVPVITWAPPAAITYGTALSATQLNASTTVPGTFVYTPAAGTVLGAGPQTLSVTFTPTDLVNYATATATVGLTVNQAKPTVSWSAPAAISYGTALSGTQLSATASVAGTFAYTPPAGTVLTVGPHTLSVLFTPNDATDYATATATVSISVSAAIPAITWPTPAPITYGTPLSLTQLNATSNVPAGVFIYTPPAGTVLGAGPQTLSVLFTPTDLVNYTTATASVSLTVNKATSSISWTAPAAITYGTALSATQLNASSATPGVFTYTPASGTVLGAGPQTLSVTLAPTDSTDYTTATATVSLTVNKATPSITWAAPAAITYGTALSATQLNASSTVQGTYAYTPAAGTVLTVGPHTLSVTFTPTDATDYTTATSTVNLTVNKATPAITWATPAAITYGTALSATQLNASSAVAGTYAYTPAAGTVLTVGPHTLSVTFTPTDATDYTTATATASLTVNKATPAITWATPAAITYGTALSATQLDASSTVAGTFTYTPAAGTVLGGGSQTLSVTLTPTDSTDYATATATVSLTVNAATPSITWATPAAITYGTALSATQLDASSTVAGTFAYTPAAGTILAAGSQSLSVTLTPTNSANYTTATAKVTLMVSAAKPSVAVTPASPSITTAQTLQVIVAVSGGAGTATPTGTITLSSGTYSAQQALAAGSATFTVPAGALLLGADTLTAAYAPDAASTADYTAASGSAAETVIQAIGKGVATVTVTPSATPITDEMAITVSVPVKGAAGQPTPTGTVTLTSGAYSAQQPLASGTASFSIPAGSLAAGADTLTASYTGDGTFAPASGTATVNVLPYVIDAPTISSIAPGNTGTGTFTVNAGSTYSGTVDLSCALTGSPNGAVSLPTCSLNPTSLPLTPGSKGTTVLTVQTTAATTAMAQPAGNGLWGIGGGGLAVVALLMFGIPSRRRRWLSMIVLLFVVAVAGTIGCGGHSSSGGGGGTGTPATTAGVYTFTVTGTDSANSAIKTSTTVSVTVN